MPIRDLPPEKPKQEKYDIDVPSKWSVERVAWMVFAVLAIIVIATFVFL
jgi:hypothetical protein